MFCHILWSVLTMFADFILCVGQNSMAFAQCEAHGKRILTLKSLKWIHRHCQFGFGVLLCAFIFFLLASNYCLFSNWVCAYLCVCKVAFYKALDCYLGGHIITKVLLLQLCWTHFITFMWLLNVRSLCLLFCFRFEVFLPSFVSLSIFRFVQFFSIKMA